MPEICVGSFQLLLLWLIFSGRQPALTLCCCSEMFFWWRISHDASQNSCTNDDGYVLSKLGLFDESGEILELYINGMQCRICMCYFSNFWDDVNCENQTYFQRWKMTKMTSKISWEDTVPVLENLFAELYCFLAVDLGKATLPPWVTVSLFV